MKHLCIQTCRSILFFILTCICFAPLAFAQEVTNGFATGTLESGLVQTASSTEDIHVDDADCDVASEDCSTPVSISVCPADALLCSDGSSVGRGGAHCAFAACPDEGGESAVPNILEKEIDKSHSYTELEAVPKETVFQRIWALCTNWFK